MFFASRRTRLKSGSIIAKRGFVIIIAIAGYVRLTWTRHVLVVRMGLTKYAKTIWHRNLNENKRN